MRCAASLMHTWSVLQKLREWRARKAPLGGKRTAEENAHWAAGRQPMSESQAKATLPTAHNLGNAAEFGSSLRFLPPSLLPSFLP